MTELVYFGLFLAFGSVVSVEDWREKKIRNRWIVLGAAACAAGLSWLMGNSVLGYRHLHFLGLGTYYLPWRYYPRVLFHLGLSLAAAVGLWWFSIWPAGDAKFYTLLSFFVVLIDPNLPGFPQLLFLLLLINIFVPAGLIFAGETALRLAARIPELWKPGRSSRLQAEADRLRVRCRELRPYFLDYVMLFVNLFALFVLLQAGLARVGRFLSWPWASLAVFLLISVIWRGLSAVLRNKFVALLSLASLSAWALAGALIWRWDVGGRILMALRMTANFGIFLSVGRGFFIWIIERESLRDSPVEHLRRGVVLSDDSWNRIGSEGELASRMDGRFSDGISEDEAATLRGWLESKGIASLSVYQTIPFAFWIFFGTLLTVSRGCNVVEILAARFGGSMIESRGLALDHAQSERAAAPRQEDPRRVEIHLGTLCNNLCPFCMSGYSRDKKDPWASFERVRQELRHFHEKGCRAVGFLGGEPTVYPHIVEAVSYAKSLGYATITVCTNGTRLSNPAFCRTLVEAGLTRVTLSVHSHVPEVEDLIITRVPGNLARKIAALKNLVALRGEGALRDRISINPVLCRPNLSGMEGFIDFFSGLGVDDIRFNYIWPDEAGVRDKAWIPSYREAMPEILRILLINETRLKKRLSFGAVPRCALALAGVSGRLLEYLSAKYFDESRFDPGNDVSLATHDSSDSRFVWQENKRDVLKTKGAECSRCAHEARCEGVWKSYVDIYGFEEFRPL